MATANHTEYNEMELKIQRQVDTLHASLCHTKITHEALEQKLATSRFSDAEKTCIRIVHRALCQTNGEDYDACQALGEEWEAQQGMLDEAEHAAMIEAEQTGDFRRAIRLHELASMALCCVTTYAH